ncbi:MAG: hypothetical protein Q4E91_10455 [Lachnospiraceae bacterium]|nr:hypothetical protein [Lachnospiraceae bacterium]
MRTFYELRLIDILSKVDITALADEVPERDLEKPELLLYAGKEAAGKKRMAMISGIAAGGVMLTGAILLICRRCFRAAA